MPVETDSQLVLGVDQEWWGLPDDVRISIADKNEFIERYTQVLQLGDTVLRGLTHTGTDRGPLDILSVSPWGEEERAEVVAGMNRHRDPSNQITPQPVKGPISREAAEATVQQIQENREKIDRYRSYNRAKRVVHVLRFLFQKESDYPGLWTENNAYFPDVITMRGKDGIEEVIVSQEAEDHYRSMPANYWRDIEVMRKWHNVQRKSKK
jgi:hypothetical protein